MIRFGFFKLGAIDWTLDHDDMPTWHPETRWWLAESRYPTNLPKPKSSNGFVWSTMLAEVARDPIGPPKALTTIGSTMWPAPLAPPPTAGEVA